MDKKNAAVLTKINSLAAIGRYIILSEEELSEALGEEADGDAIKKACKELASDGYIDLKYSGGGMFCVAPLKYPEKDEQEETTQNIQSEREVTVVKTGKAAAFFAALLGGAAGSLIASLILSVI